MAGEIASAAISTASGNSARGGGAGIGPQFSAGNTKEQNQKAGFMNLIDPGNTFMGIWNNKSNEAKNFNEDAQNNWNHLTNNYNYYNEKLNLPAEIQNYWWNLINSEQTAHFNSTAGRDINGGAIATVHKEYGTYGQLDHDAVSGYGQIVLDALNRSITAYDAAVESAQRNNASNNTTSTTVAGSNQNNAVQNSSDFIGSLTDQLNGLIKPLMPQTPSYNAVEASRPTMKPVIEVQDYTTYIVIGLAIILIIFMFKKGVGKNVHANEFKRIRVRESSPGYSRINRN